MGRIAAPHGVRGWVKVVPWSHDPAVLIAHKAWWVKAPGTQTWREIEVVLARVHSNVLVAEFAGIGSREEATVLRGSEIALPRESLTPPADNEYYWSDLEGMDVVNRSGVRLGRVVGLTESGAHPLLRVVSEIGAGERLIPFVPAHIDSVDVSARRIDVDWEADY
jgi:16S rRNA processing protein RimM